MAPVDAWRAIVEDDDVRRSYQSRRGLGGFLLPILFGMLLDVLRVRTTCFMLLYGIVWVSLILIYLSEVRRTRVTG
ncbi:hypothetical protein BamMEX5DRAFT_3295 [Burkholderia ambifaria MEX-5]|uniref:Major facilitator superfamily MFS_1 n=1 Tax=Burkholderia ambifaria MEX-5 TaxID=396597 RepID=B1T679_9BURK|nr:hypothetical protein BamMEX5DRAFT_3295 [Burkholderia ambifaria MEX-5]